MEKPNLPLNYVDTHAHLYNEQFKPDREEVVRRAGELGVGSILLPNVDGTSIDAMLETEQRFPVCRAAMGLHPCSVNKHFEKELYTVEAWLGQRPFVAVGEIGLDKYWDTTYFTYQLEAFRQQCAWAKQYQLPVMIHVREAMPELLSELENLQDGTLKGVVHCFTGTLEQAQKTVELGFYLGIGGVATFAKGGLDAVLPHVATDKLILETDSPYLAPKPHRGKRNSPEYIPLIAQRVADLQQIPLEELARQTTQNAHALFPINHV